MDLAARYYVMNIRSKYFFNRESDPNYDHSHKRKKDEMPIDVFESYLGGWRPDLLTFYKEKLEKKAT